MGIVLLGCYTYSIRINALCAMPEEILHMATAALEVCGSPVWPVSILPGNVRLNR